MRRQFGMMLLVVAMVAGLQVASPPIVTMASGAGETTMVRLEGLSDRITVGDLHTCVILDSGDVSCWGSGGFGRLGYGNSNDIGDDEMAADNPVNGGILDLPGDRPAVAIVAGGAHTCALLDDGKVTCWGYNGYGNLGYGNTNEIGDDEMPAANPVNGGIVALPGGRPAVAIAAGSTHNCALLDNGTVTCWGDGGLGKLGYGNTNNIGDDETPAANPVNGGLVALPGGRTAEAITAGDSHTCALLDNGTITCWGFGVSGRLGYGNIASIGDDETPAANPVSGGIVALPGGLTALAVSAGFAHTCALLENGTVTCWGLGASGRLGYGNIASIGDDETPAANPVSGGIVGFPDGRPATAVTVGQDHTCVRLDDGHVVCWGVGAFGRLGYGNSNNIGDDDTPVGNPSHGYTVALPGGHTAAAVTAGGFHTCAMLDNGLVTCWGNGLVGQLGFGNTTNIGDNETPAENTTMNGIVTMPGSHAVAQLDGGGAHTCALLENGTVTCWGFGSNGELGHGNTNHIGDDETPADNPMHGGIVDLPGDLTATAITAGFVHTCALLADGTVTCWGNGQFGRLGYGNTTSIGFNNSPAENPFNGGRVALPGGLTATAITAGGSHTCALLADGTVTCWGYNSLGQLGYGNTNAIGDDETPAANPVNGGVVDLPGDHTAVAITAGSSHTCAVLDDGSVTCWGNGFDGRLGYGNTNAIGDNETPATNPVNGGLVDLPGTQGAIAISAGEYHTCAVLDDGGVSCWGSGSDGQLGYNSTNSVGQFESPTVYGTVVLPGGRTATSVTTGGSHTCAVLNDGTLTCWGLGSSGQLGYGNVNKIGDNETPAGNPVNGGIVDLPGDHDVTMVSAGGYHTCAALTSGGVSCWGGGGGVLGYGNPNAIGDDETPATNPTNGGLIELPNHLSPIDYRAVTPARLLDTRSTGATIDDQFEAGGQRAAGSTLQLAVAGRGGTPADAASVTLSIAAVSPSAVGYITVWPCAEPQPLASSINYVAGVTTANTVITGMAGGVCIFTNRATHLIADVVGFTPRSSTYTPLTPARYADTRATGATFDDQYENLGTLAAGSTLTLPIADRGAVPAGTDTVVLNVAAVLPSAGGFITVHPCGVPRPNASNINYITGVTAANLVVTSLPANGEVCVYTSSATHLIVDVVGYFADGAVPAPPMLRTFNPGRLVDTRPTGVTTDGRFTDLGTLTPNATNTYPIAHRFPLASADVVVLNITAVNPPTGGFVTVWPCDQPKPNASSLNYVAGTNRAVQIVTALSASGTLCVSSSRAIHLVIDASGSTL